MIAKQQMGNSQNSQGTSGTLFQPRNPQSGDDGSREPLSPPPLSSDTQPPQEQMHPSICPPEGPRGHQEEPLVMGQQQVKNYYHLWPREGNYFGWVCGDGDIESGPGALQGELLKTVNECYSVRVQNIYKHTQYCDIIDYIVKNGLGTSGISKQFISQWFYSKEEPQILTLNFHTPFMAQYYYFRLNFQTELYFRPVNAYLLLPVQPINQFRLQGVTKQNQLDVFLTASQLGPCRIDIEYTRHEQWNGRLSFVLSRPLSRRQTIQLARELELKGVQCLTSEPLQIHKPLRSYPTPRYILFLQFLPPKEKFTVSEAEEKLWRLIQRVGVSMLWEPFLNVFRSPESFAYQELGKRYFARVEFPSPRQAVRAFELLTARLPKKIEFELKSLQPTLGSSKP